MSAKLGPKLATSGLVFAVDAYNPRSYTGSGSTWYDLSGNAVNGTMNTITTFSKYFQFNGSSSYVNFGNNSLGVDVQNKTICCWVNPTSSGSIYGLVDRDFDLGGTNYGGWGLWLSSTLTMQWWVHANKDLVDTTSVPTNKWSYLAVSWNTTTKTASFYINGALTSTRTDNTIVEKSSGSINLNIGAFRSGTGAFFPGNISLVQVYNRTLSSVEIIGNYNGTKSRFF